MLISALARLRRDEEGQGLTEYALILVFVMVVAVLALTFLGTQVSNLLSMVGTSI
jgi:Flp pilus assembly pilin Flp